MLGSIHILEEKCSYVAKYVALSASGYKGDAEVKVRSLLAWFW